MASVSDVSRSERRAKRDEPIAVSIVVEEAPMWAREPLSGFGIANVPGSATKWFAYKCSTDGTVKPLTPLFNGTMRGEGQPNATGRLKLALMKFLGGVE